MSSSLYKAAAPLRGGYLVFILVWLPAFLHLPWIRCPGQTPLQAGGFFYPFEVGVILLFVFDRLDSVELQFTHALFQYDNPYPLSDSSKYATWYQQNLKLNLAGTHLLTSSSLDLKAFPNSQAFSLLCWETPVITWVEITAQALINVSRLYSWRVAGDSGCSKLQVPVGNNTLTCRRTCWTC